MTVLLALLAGIVYAFVTLDLSTFPNDPIWVDADVDDFRRFSARVTRTDHLYEGLA